MLKKVLLGLLTVIAIVAFSALVMLAGCATQKRCGAATPASIRYSCSAEEMK